MEQERLVLAKLWACIPCSSTWDLNVRQCEIIVHMYVRQPIPPHANAAQAWLLWHRDTGRSCASRLFGGLANNANERRLGMPFPECEW